MQHLIYLNLILISLVTLVCALTNFTHQKINTGKLPDAEYVRKHWDYDQHVNIEEEQWNDKLSSNSLVDSIIQKIIVRLNTRILHCPPDSKIYKETQHDETNHERTNYIIKTVIFSIIITCGLLANFFILAILQYFQISPLRTALRAEAVAITSYLVILIPIYPLANIYPYTGTFQLYEVAKPYVLPFFQTCLDIAEVLLIWMFVWLNRVRYIKVVLHDKPAAERCTPKSVRDELRLMTCLGIVFNLPKFFDTEVKEANDPCNPGSIIILRQPNSLGVSLFYIMLYKVVLVSLVYYIIPFVWLAKITYNTHSSLSPEVIPSGDTKQSIMQERVKTPDGITTELDRRVLLFYICLLPGAFFNIAKYVQYLLPLTNQGYVKIAEVSELITMILVTLYCAFVSFACYMLLFDAFREKAKEKYYDRFLNLYQEYQRKKQLEKDFQLLERRLLNERS